ncbi:MAG TPA: efflux transporter outer membrane subunit [Pyrinomonadaceae bacterium]|jgi:multidrug efflux system outer membrane protein
MKRLIIILLIVSMSQGIAFGQKKKYEPPKVQTPVDYRGATAPAQPNAQSLADVKWFEVFKDEKLQGLIRQALIHNYDLRESVARIDAARASLGLTRSEQFPTIGGSTDMVIERLSRDGAVTLPGPAKRDRSFGSVLLNLFTFELDIWGRLRKATAASRADLLASEEARRAVMTTIVSDVAGAYFNLRELDYELEIAKRTSGLRRESLAIIRMRAENGVSNMLEVRQAEELVYDAEEVIPALEMAIEKQENFISFLTGKNPQDIPRGSELTEQQMPPEVPAGLPSDLIERRPDIRSAEQDLLAANLRIEVAKKAFFPRISLTGFLGFESDQLTKLFSPSRSVWGLLPQIAQPIFTGGRLKSNVRLTQAERDLLLVNYERTIQNAFRDVSDSLVAYRKVKEVRSQRELLVGTLQDRSRLSYMRYRYGVSNLLEALDADRELFDAELGLARTRRDELLTVVLLYKALGGGWQV